MLQAWFLRSYGTYIWKLREKFQIFDFSCNKKFKNAIVQYV